MFVPSITLTCWVNGYAPEQAALSPGLEGTRARHRQRRRIGLEANMTPADYPMIRIVPSRLALSDMMGARQVEALVYFGRPVHEFEAGLEALYAELLDMEEAIINALHAGAYSGRYLETITDEDRVDGYKLMALRVVVEG